MLFLFKDRDTSVIYGKIKDRLKDSKSEANMIKCKKRIKTDYDMCNFLKKKKKLLVMVIRNAFVPIWSLKAFQFYARNINLIDTDTDTDILLNICICFMFLWYLFSIFKQSGNWCIVYVGRNINCFQFKVFLKVFFGFCYFLSSGWNYMMQGGMYLLIQISNKHVQAFFIGILISMINQNSWRI